ncbi:MAG: hypothetical protein ABJQ70_14225 [Roseobacter sp.]
MTARTANHQADLLRRYMVLTKDVMPQMVRNPAINGPVQNDHFFFIALF